jgi:hypothetical protein
MHMILGVSELYRLLHNDPPDIVTHYIKKHADNVRNSLILLGHVVDVKQIYKTELAEGATFGVVFSKHINNIKQSEHQKNKSVGLGDTIAKVTKRLGIKQCGGCKKRQKILNKALPYKR